MTKGTYTLAIDLGTKMGWAARFKNGEIFSGTLKFNGSTRQGVKFKQMREWLENQPKPDAVYYEMVYRHMGGAPACAFGGFLAILQCYCEERGIPYHPVGVQAIKKHATGRGNAHKNAMIVAMQDRGHYPKDDNEADAIALLYLATEGEKK